MTNGTVLLACMYTCIRVEFQWQLRTRLHSPEPIAMMILTASVDYRSAYEIILFGGWELLVSIMPMECVQLWSGELFRVTCGFVVGNDAWNETVWLHSCNATICSIEALPDQASFPWTKSHDLTGNTWSYSIRNRKTCFLVRSDVTLPWGMMCGPKLRLKEAPDQVSFPSTQSQACFCTKPALQLCTMACFSTWSYSGDQARIDCMEILVITSTRIGVALPYINSNTWLNFLRLIRDSVMWRTSARDYSLDAILTRPPESVSWISPVYGYSDIELFWRRLRLESRCNSVLQVVNSYGCWDIDCLTAS